MADYPLDSPLLEQIAQDLEDALHAAGESLDTAFPSWQDLADEAKARLKAGVLVLLSEHASNVIDLIAALSHDVQDYARGEPESEEEPAPEPAA